MKKSRRVFLFPFFLSLFFISIPAAQKEPVRRRSEPQPVRSSWDDLQAGVRTPEQWKTTLESIPLKRLGDPNDLAEAAVFLASNGGNFITGATLDVNGGLHMG